MWAIVFPKLFLAVVAYAIWIVGVVWVASRLGWWDRSLTTTTVLWFLTAGVVLFAKFDDVTTDPHWFRRCSLQVFGVAVVLEGLTSVLVYSLPIEILLFVVITCLGLLSVVGGMDPRLHGAKRLVDGVLTLIGLAIVARSVIGFLAVLLTDEAANSLRQAGLVVWLPIGGAVFVLVVGVLTTHGNAWSRVNGACKANGLGNRHRWRAKAVLSTAFARHPRDLRTFNGMWPSRIAGADSTQDARAVISEFRKSEAVRRERERERAQREAEYQERLQRFAGVAGTHEDGGQLDRREFRETQAVLRWLANCQSGWYQRQGGVYLQRVLDFLDSDASRRGLPEQHGVQMEIATDGQAWFAWRRTVGDWVFAIGASGPPPNEWLFDGPEPPTDFPSSGAQWGTAPFADDVSPNWRD
jgi:hypothetical protein